MCGNFGLLALPDSVGPEFEQHADVLQRMAASKQEKRLLRCSARSECCASRVCTRYTAVSRLDRHLMNHICMFAHPAASTVTEIRGSQGGGVVSCSWDCNLAVDKQPDTFRVRMVGRKRHTLSKDLINRYRYEVRKVHSLLTLMMLWPLTLHFNTRTSLFSRGTGADSERDSASEGA